jgi:hypothetical protein
MADSIGAIHADLLSIRYDQTTKIIERFLADLKASGQTKFWLESCNVCAVGCSVEAVDGRWKYPIPAGPDGRPLFSQADLMAFYLYSTYGQKFAPVVKEGVCENEVKENLAWVASQCATVKADVVYCSSPDDLIAKIDKCLTLGGAVALSYLTDYGSGHFVSIVKKRLTDKKYIVNDSWYANTHCKKNGVQEEYDEEFFMTRCKDRLSFVRVYKES